MKNKVLLSILILASPLAAADDAPAFHSPDPWVSKMFESCADGMEMLLKAERYDSARGIWKQMKEAHEQHASYAALPLAQREPGRWEVSAGLLEAQAKRLEEWKQQIIAGRAQQVRNAPGSWKTQIFWWTLGTTVTLGVVWLVAKKCGWLEDVSGEALAKTGNEKKESEGIREI